jgi:flavin-dependent dehydrogenase
MTATVQDVERYDVAIIGGGPAGAATALSLRSHAPHLSIALIEQSNYDKLRIGETLPPSAQSLLERLGVWQVFLNDGYVPAYGTCATWGSDRPHENEFIYHPAQRGWHLDRRRFDAMLTGEAAGRGVSIFRNSKCARSHAIHGNGYRLNVQRESGEFSIDAQFVVDATGRKAVFAAQQQAQKTVIDQLLGVFVFFEFNRDPLVDTYTLVEACEDGWWYSALLPDARLAVGFMSDADIIKVRRLNSSNEWLALLGNARLTKERAKNARITGPPKSYPASSQRLERFSGDNWLAAGDAASTFDPLSSAGIVKGLRSGVLASYAIGDYFKGDQSGLLKYDAILKREFENYLATRIAFYRKEMRWLDSVFWRRRHCQITNETKKTHRSMRVPHSTTVEPSSSVAV